MEHMSPVYRPPRKPYRLRDLARFPIRMLNPPPAPCKVRSLKISPDFSIQLDDLLANKHLPPMALKDFEEYLLFDEMTAENLYFILWLRSYVELYESTTTSESDKIKDLEIRSSRAALTFFNPSSPFALNLPQDIASPILSASPPFSPTAFDPARKHVRDLLDTSLKTFVRRCCGNATTNRSWFSVSLAGISVVLGILVALGSVFLGWPRGVRFVAYPLLILGFTGVFAGMHGLCMIIYTFADARQLYPYELDAGKDLVSAVPASPAFSDVHQSTGLLIIVGSSSSLRFSSAADFEEHHIGTPEDEKDAKLGVDSTPITPQTTPPFSGALYTAPFIPYQGSSMSGTVASSIKTFDFDSLPVPMHKRVSYEVKRSSPTFGALTGVLSPIVVRGQWEIAARSMVWSFIVSTALMAALAAVPYVK